MRKQIGPFELTIFDSDFSIKYDGIRSDVLKGALTINQSEIDDLEYLVSVVKKEFERLNGGRV